MKKFTETNIFFRRSESVFIVFCITLMISSCANLTAVRDFAKQSASLTSGQEVIDYWSEWNERSKEFDDIIAKLSTIKGKTPITLPGPINTPSKEETDNVKALLLVISMYMNKLGGLAEDDAVDLSKQADGLVASLNKLPSEIPEEKQKKINTAYGSIIKLIKLPLDAYRRYKIQEIVKENDENIQLLIGGLKSSIGSVAKFIEGEKSGVINWYHLITEEYPACLNFSSAYQWKKDKESIIEPYNKKIAAIHSFQNALETIGKSHAKIKTDLSSFNTESSKQLFLFLDDACKQIVSAHEQYIIAFE
ncbi:MAG: hypothetical protein V1816_04250 [Pseudomonadota bacterium]